MRRRRIALLVALAALLAERTRRLDANERAHPAPPVGPR